MATLKEPLYHQIKQQLLKELDEGKFAIGAEFYTEPQLEKQFGVSRGTVRKALSDLENTGLLTRHSGKGTFVARLPSHPAIAKESVITPFSQLLGDAELKSSTVVLKKEKDIKAGELGEHILQAFNISPNEPMICIQRLRLADEVPLAIQTVFLCQKDCPDLLAEDLTQSLLGLYEEKCRRRITTADETLSLVQATTQEARLLKIPAETLVVLRQRISYDQKRHPFEALRSIEKVGAFAYRYYIQQAKSRVVRLAATRKA